MMKKITYEDIVRDPEGSARIIRGRIIANLMERGWTPPPLKDHQALRLIEDLGSAGSLGQTLTLTPKEREVVEMMAEGDSVREIATKTGKSEETVRDQAKSLRRKLGARNSTHAVAMVLRDAA